MAIPTTFPITLSDVITEVNPTSDTLQSCFDDATGNFDPSYAKSGEWLSEFRGYPVNLDYGLLYNGYCVASSNFAPTDWAIPTYAQCQTLGSDGGDLKETGTTHWLTPNTGATNSTGFTCLGAGEINSAGNQTNFKGWGTIAYYPLYGLNNTGAVLLTYNSDGITQLVVGTSNDHGLSIRLIYTGSGTPSSTITDYDGNTYDTILINGEYWTVQNWKCTHLNNGTAIDNVTSPSTWIAAGSGDYYSRIPS